MDGRAAATSTVATLQSAMQNFPSGNDHHLLVLTTAFDGSTHHDRWVGDTFFYKGMGLHGDQSLSFAQNRTLADSTRTGIPVFLFEKLRADAYRFVGRVHLVGAPRPETQLDVDDRERTVWVFPPDEQRGVRGIRRGAGPRP